MKIPLLSFTVLLGLLFVSCSSEQGVQKASIQCSAPFKGKSFVGLYSFKTGDLSDCLKKPGECASPDKCADQLKAVDLMYYFDNNDCTTGVLVGREYSGHIFPVGKESWSEVENLKPPTKNSKSVGAIGPLTKSREGMAFWVKTADRKFVWVRIKAIQPATYSDLAAGKKPTIFLEWGWPGNKSSKHD